VGNPSQVIVATVKETVADLVVVAAHRDDVLDRIFGSVVDHVVQRAPCSVLVLRTTR
jgi:universal stress protein F